ncbi:putative membrane protein [Roseovarius sp. MBR-78]|uniref:DUF2254 domain-containing protein n=1 Tax=Roseovarius sp. MBR-78 TaxID=3156460 RepID=UPI003393BEC9
MDRFRLSALVMGLLEFCRQLWLRVSLYAVVAVIAAAVAILLEDRIPSGLRDRVTPEAVMPILTILASGMLAVSTFSLNVMLTAHNAAAGKTTPRVYRVLLADTTTHKALAAFIGAFVYALTAIILFKAGIYPAASSVLVLGFTVAVVVLVIVQLLRWIHHLSGMSSLDATLDTIETEARGCLERVRRHPALGGSVMTAGTVIPTGAQPIHATATGHVQTIDTPRLHAMLAARGAQGAQGALVYLRVRPGDYVVAGETIGQATGLDEAARRTVAGHLVVAAHRNFAQDASYGLLLLSETSARALSPGINDPGTAIAVIARLEKLLLDWAHATPAPGGPLFPQIFLPDASRHAMIENAFAQTARDGAGQIEVAERLRAALLRLSGAPDPALAEAARAMAGRALEHAEVTLRLESERARLRAAGGGISFLF